MHENAQRARLLADLGTHTIRNCETDWNLPQNWGHDSLCKSHNFLNPLKKKRFFEFYQVAPTVLDVYEFQEPKAATKSDFMICCSETVHLQKGKHSSDRECWWKELSVWVGWCSPGAWPWGERCSYKGGITPWVCTVVCLKMDLQGTFLYPTHYSWIQS